MPKKDIFGRKRKNHTCACSMIVTYYIKLFHTGTNRDNGMLMPLLLLVAEEKKSIWLQPLKWMLHNHCHNIKVRYLHGRCLQLICLTCLIKRCSVSTHQKNIQELAIKMLNAKIPLLLRIVFMKPTETFQ